MALSLMLRNCPKLKGLSALSRGTFPVSRHQNFTQLVCKNRTALPLAVKCHNQFVKAIEPTRKMSADHSKLWSIEKLFSLILLGVVPATFICPNKILDNLFAVAVVMHFHWGLEACVVDYVRPIIVGPVLPKLALGLLYVVSATTLAALIYYNQHQIGIGQTFRKFWCISGTPADNEAKNQ
ncbi:hypothetical protein ABEB36_003381 [Hypothenemus hampei]|uniref:Succinate dehydrogenase [ubiquinone] cytochrome b small subunit n=1 Tax=Hypothenemus hampei TaxID=57062 RepID=A0ABD1F901_HYPHA